MTWALAQWWNVGSEAAPYLVPADRVRAMDVPGNESAWAVLVLHTLRAEVNAALESANRELTRRREWLGLD